MYHREGIPIALARRAAVQGRPSARHARRHTPEAPAEQPAQQEPYGVSARTTLHLFVIAVALAGVACLFAAINTAGSENWTFLGAMAAGILVSEAFDFRVRPGGRVSLSVGLIFAAGIFGDLSGAMVAAVTCAAADFAFHRQPIMKGVFNFGSIAVTAAVFVGVIEAFSPLYDEGDRLAMTGPAIAGALAAFAVNAGLVSFAIAFERQMVVLDLVRQAFGWVVPQFVLLAVFGIFAVMLYDRWQLAGLLLTLGPVSALWLNARMYLKWCAATDSHTY